MTKSARFVSNVGVGTTVVPASALGTLIDPSDLTAPVPDDEVLTTTA